MNQKKKIRSQQTKEPHLFEFEVILLLPVIIYKEEEYKRERENFWKSIQLLFIKRKNDREKFWKLIQILFIKSIIVSGRTFGHPFK